MNPSDNMQFDEAICFYNAALHELSNYAPSAQIEFYRHYCRTDLFFLLVYVLKRKDMVHPWIYDRCREVQANPNGHLDLWAREHYKSTVITIGLTIQDILNNPEATICIFSHTRPQAKKFLAQIKQEFEHNTDLKLYFSDILWASPSGSPKWSEDEGIVVKRKSNPKEATLSAYGLVDGMPTGMHFSHRIYDDVVTERSVTSPDMVKKIDDQLALSVDLGTSGGVERYIGTRYSNFDSYRTLLERKVLIPRIYPACQYKQVDGAKIEIDFDSAVLKEPDELRAKYRKQGAYIFGCQQLQNPMSDATKQLSVENLRYWDTRPGERMNRCIIVDPASGKKSQVNKNGQTLDNTVMWVLARGADDNWYLLDGVVDKLNLQQRAEKLMELHEMHKPHKVFYEEYGMQADIAHIKYRMEMVNYRFEITAIGGNMPKKSRIMRLQPVIDANRIYLPRSLVYYTTEGKAENLIRKLIDEELAVYPIVAHDDMLDCLSRICDEDIERLVPLPKYTAAVDRQVEIIKQIRKEQRKNRPLV